MILDTIAAAVARRLAEDIRQISRDEMRQMALATPAAEGFPLRAGPQTAGHVAYLRSQEGVAVEGVIAEEFPYVDIARGLRTSRRGGHIRPDGRDYFQGSCRYLQEISSAVKTPLLRKDFIIDEYQVDEARRSGASAALLICALLDDENSWTGCFGGPTRWDCQLWWKRMMKMKYGGPSLSARASSASITAT